MPRSRCPCLSGQTYADCCRRLHRGELAAPTAELLMRSRFSAFAVGDADYLHRTWHRTTRPERFTLDAALRWYRLDIGATTLGGAHDVEGTVEFRAFYRSPAGPGEQHEVSRFVRAGREWTYLDGSRSRSAAVVVPPVALAVTRSGARFWIHG